MTGPASVRPLSPWWTPCCDDRWISVERPGRCRNVMATSSPCITRGRLEVRTLHVGPSFLVSWWHVENLGTLEFWLWVLETFECIFHHLSTSKVQKIQLKKCIEIHQFIPMDAFWIESQTVMMLGLPTQDKKRATSHLLRFKSEITIFGNRFW